MIRFPDVPDRLGLVSSALPARVRSGRLWMSMTCATGHPTPGQPTRLVASTVGPDPRTAATAMDELREYAAAHDVPDQRVSDRRGRPMRRRRSARATERSPSWAFR